LNGHVIAQETKRTYVSLTAADGGKFRGFRDTLTIPPAPALFENAIDVRGDILDA